MDGRFRNCSWKPSRLPGGHAIVGLLELVKLIVGGV